MKVEHINALKPLIKNPSKMLLCAFDVETHGKTNEFLMGSVASFNTDDSIYTRVFYDKQSMKDYILHSSRFNHTNSVVFATNLQFDYLALFDSEEDLASSKLMFRDSRLIMARYYLGKWRNVKFFDTLNHCAIGVSQIGEVLGMPKLEKPCFLGNQPCDLAEWKILEDYNIRDTELTLKFAKFLQDNYNRIGSNMKCTLPSTTMDLFRRKYLKEPIKQPNRDIITTLQKGYYGGRTEVIKRGKIKDCFLYDINSLYPCVMNFSMPNPNYCYYMKNRDEQNFYNVMNHEGVSLVEMYCPKDMHLPYLPLRSDKLLFPTGLIKGYYSHYEIREAIKLGYELISVTESISYTRTHTPFRDFVQDMYMNRLQNMNNSTQLIYKILMNSLYGKFAQRIEGEPEIRHIHSFTRDEFFNLWNNPDIEMNVVGNFVYLKKPVTRIPAYINPIYSVYITAYARDLLYKSLPEDVYYMDTDSCITKEELEVGMGMGEWKREAVIEDGLIVKPKFYYYNDVVKVKGCGRMTVEDFQILIDTGKYSFERISKFKESLRRDLSFNTRLDQSKTLSLEDDKRTWQNKFNPFELEESKPLLITPDHYS